MCNDETYSAALFLIYSVISLFYKFIKLPVNDIDDMSVTIIVMKIINLFETTLPI